MFILLLTNVHAVPGQGVQSRLQLLIDKLCVRCEQVTERVRDSLAHTAVLVQYQLQVTLVALEPRFLRHDGCCGFRDLDSEARQPFGLVDQL
ncbi:hypothetical protein DPMN_055652 [Dreissena polymorpha]|uniref:Uncharacterized protein n=1 Tax=Dreissena polymorpha TaxID=45954 RepID=A0A9D4CS06_DREPO|nr:hypothetical protein DPMN_055652 [Dreissena polymorpha]